MSGAERVQRHVHRLNHVEIPDVADPSRREACRLDLLRYCQTYGREACPLEFGEDHISAIELLQGAVLNGGRVPIGMPRGSGKTTLVRLAMQWAASYGHRRYICIIGADMDAAKDIVGAITSAFIASDALRADFPEIAAPMVAADGVALKAKRLHIDGESLHMELSTRRLVLPTVEGSPSSGVRIEAYGLTGRINGAFHQTATGTVERPDFVFLDDPQRPRDATSTSEVAKRENLILGSVMGLAGPSRRIAAAMTCTVMEPDDLADRMLDRERNPDWHGLTSRMVYQWPDAIETLWVQYAEIRRDERLQGSVETPKATAFYAANRDAMDAGARVYWSARYHPHELSAIQHAFNLRMDLGEKAFAAEYQNQPIRAQNNLYTLTAESILAATNTLPPRAVPPNILAVVAGIDLNRYGIHYLVAATTRYRAMYVLDYGVFPGGGRVLYRGDGSDIGTEEQSFRRELDRILALLDVRYPCVDGSNQTRKLDAVFIDAGYQSGAVHSACDAGRFGFAAMPCKGYGARMYRPSAKHGRVGEDWHESIVIGKGRAVMFNADSWRVQSQRAWLQPIGAAGSASVFTPPPGTSHAELATQCSRERLLGIEDRGTYRHHIWDTKSHEWHDLGDCLSIAHVAASYMGASVVMEPVQVRTTRRSAAIRDTKIKPA